MLKLTMELHAETLSELHTLLEGVTVDVVHGAEACDVPGREYEITDVDTTRCEFSVTDEIGYITRCHHEGHGYPMGDGGKVVLCARHRSWIVALAPVATVSAGPGVQP